MESPQIYSSVNNPPKVGIEAVIKEYFHVSEFSYSFRNRDIITDISREILIKQLFLTG